MGDFTEKSRTLASLEKIIKLSQTRPEFQHEDDPGCEQGLLAPPEARALWSTGVPFRSCYFASACLPPLPYLLACKHP